MGRYAKVKTFIWKDPDIRRLPYQQRYLYLWCFTNEACGISGMYALDLDVARFETGLKGRAFDGAWMGLLGSGKVHYDPASSVVWVVGKFKQEMEPSYRDPKRAPSTKTITGAVREIEELPSSPLVKAFCLKYRAFVEGLLRYDETADAPTVGLPSHPIPSHPIPTTTHKPPSYSDGFLRFWKIAGKGSKKRTWDEYQKTRAEAKERGTDEDEMVRYLISRYEIQAKGKQARRDANQFTAEFQDTERWLRNRRYEDKPEKPD